jgi:DNA-binding transcriptional MerR regulator
MIDDRNGLWTIDELGVQVASALAHGYDGPHNGRVRDVPDQRTIRYYTTLGLLDRAFEMRGRTALYGRRHLLQLVAIKKLQARGQSLAEVQAALAGQTDAGLEQIAGLPRGEFQGQCAAVPRASRDFWRQTPRPHAAAKSKDDGDKGEREKKDRPAVEHGPRTFQGLPLSEGVTLLLALSRPLEADDLKALRKAAAPLLNLLTRRRLISPREEGKIL